MSDTNARHTVLIVDDEDLARVLLQHIIERLNVPNLEIVLAEDGLQAIDLIEAKRPDLILLDVLLPKMNGYDVCRHIRQIADYNPHVIILTARGIRTDRQQAEAMGANDFMTKPFNPSRLMSQLADLWGI
ncbi:MAG: response regulator [Chloroflexi bacterium]|nr:response regulator [Chloroflexota bacterium]